MRCPGQLYVASERKYEGMPEDLEYPQMCSRRVSPTGAIKIDGQRFLAGWSVGLKPIASDLMEYSGGYPPK